MNIVDQGASAKALGAYVRHINRPPAAIVITPTDPRSPAGQWLTSRLAMPPAMASLLAGSAGTQAWEANHG